MKLRLQHYFCIFALSFWASTALEKNFSVTSEDRIKSHGYAAESHFVETTDGYILNLFRLPYSHKLNNQNKYRPAILLQHGLLSNSDCWLCNGPDNSLAYNLVDAGYDVWLGNARGNIYSRKNNKISPNNSKFWEFSWHEIGVIDIATMIDYILEQTGQSAIHYAGHSQGTTVYFVLMSERPEYNAKIKSAHMLAPCAYFSNGASVLLKLLPPEVTSLKENMEWFPRNKNFTIDTSCVKDGNVLAKFCSNIYMRLVGVGYGNTNTSSLLVMLESFPSSASTNQGIHYFQSYISGKFRRWNYGKKKNLRVYGQSSPPDYDLSKIVAPTYLYSGENDALCKPKDVEILEKNLIHMAGHHRVPNPWSHVDFITAYKIKEKINDRVIATSNTHETF